MRLPTVPRVSACVPVFNTASLLGRCLDSLIGQSMNDLEIIVVDDGSTDASPEVIQRYAARDPRIVTMQQVNAGLGATRNAGLRAATGEYVAFLDADDWVVPECYEALYAEAKASKSDLVVCDYAIHRSRGGKEAPSVYRHPPEVRTKDEYIRALLERRVPGFSWNKLYRRRTLLDGGLLFPLRGEFENLEDQYYSLRATYISRGLAFVSRPLVNYWIHPGSIVQRYQPTLVRDVFELYMRNRAFLKEMGAGASAMAALEVSLLFGVFGCVLNECKDANPRPLRARLDSIERLRSHPLFQSAIASTDAKEALGSKVAAFLWLLRRAPPIGSYLAAASYRSMFLKGVF